ncbi:MAG: DUF1592 domain-containing protein, partial [Planctomycetaceae bacterium]
SLFLIAMATGAITIALSAPDRCAADDSPAEGPQHRYASSIEPIFQEHCYGCHSDGTAEGGFSFDKLPATGGSEADRRQWWTVLRKLRAGTMPPVDEPAPSPEQKALIDQWIKSDVFQVDPERPDPGYVTLRRLNRAEYRNTVSALLGIDYDTNASFPPDDTGHGFDNIADVLTVSPMLLEKYLDAAREVVQAAVPLVSGVPRKRFLSGQFFQTGEEKWNSAKLSYKDAATLSQSIDIPHSGSYVVQLHFQATQSYVEGEFDYNACRLIFKIDGETVLEKELYCQNWVNHEYKFDRQWQAGPHPISLELVPLTPDQPNVRKPAIEFRSVTIFGPDDPDQYDRPERYEKFFPQGVAPEAADQRCQYAREIIERFATRAYRRPVDQPTLDRLVSLAEYQYSEAGKTFEAAVADAMTAILASPRFLFREESLLPAPGQSVALIDEFSLASRLSYFLWSSMPDDELLQLAKEGRLRKNLSAQIDRMLADDRSKEFFKNFVGQWLQSRDIENLAINTSAIIQRERVPEASDDAMREVFRSLRRKPESELTPEQRELIEAARERRKQFEELVKRTEPNGEVKRAMRAETEMLFEHLIREDRPLHELLDSDYAFLNEALAEYYKIEGVEGRSMQRVTLPPDSLRGGVLTQATFLSITSNPDRTSPVKRGKFILENLLGTPTAAPPPDIPPLEQSEQGEAQRKLTLRESLELHRASPLCASCHNAMDPLGLALENFNALGHYREQESTGPIDPSGKLISGDQFASIKELKAILAAKYRRELYTCVTEKLLTYALGRGIDYHDVESVDQIVAKLEAADGKAGGLVHAVIESAPFQFSRVRHEEPVVMSTTTSLNESASP